MNKIEMYFLQYKFVVFVEADLLNRFSVFWQPFLISKGDYDEFVEWEIHFFVDTESKTIVNQSERKILHYSNSVCHLTELNNLFREAIVKISALYGVVWFHCSAVHYNGKTQLFLGNKGDGKTTLLMNYLKDSSCEFVGNDQLPLFEYDGRLCTMCWRPDIKIQSENQLDAKELILVNHKDLSFIDFESMSRRVRKNIIKPTKQYTFNYKANCIYPIDRIVVLDSEPVVTHCPFDLLLSKIDENDECVLSYKLEDIPRYMPYWNKRILGLQTLQQGRVLNDNVLELCKKVDIVKVGNRMEFQEVKKELKERIDE